MFWYVIEGPWDIRGTEEIGRIGMWWGCCYPAQKEDEGGRDFVYYTGTNDDKGLFLRY